MQAARDLGENAATTSTALESDAVAAANAASASQFNLTSSSLTTTQLTDKRQVEVDASIPGLVFFSQIPEIISAHLSKLPQRTLRATSVAGVSYSLISSQATCYAFDSYNYLFSTGAGTLDTAHSSGIDPFYCGSPPSPPSAHNAYCGTGIIDPLLQALLNGLWTIASQTQTATENSVYTGQADNGIQACTTTSMNNLYSNSTANPELDPSFTNILDSSSSHGGLVTTDVSNICGTSPVASLTPIGPSQIIVASSAAGSSTLTFLR